MIRAPESFGEVEVDAEKGNQRVWRRKDARLSCDFARGLACKEKRDSGRERDLFGVDGKNQRIQFERVNLDDTLELSTILEV